MTQRARGGSGAPVATHDDGLSPFARVNGVLHADGVPLDLIAEAVGTPTYVYSASGIRDRYRRLEQAFRGVPHRIHFAMKANSCAAVLRLLHETGAGVDIVSGGELNRARRAGFRGSDVVFSGVGKSDGEIEAALDAGVLLLNVESEPELHAIDAVAAGRGMIAPVAIRVNPEVTVETPHAYIRTGEKGQKFGIPRDDVARLCDVIAELRHVRLRGMGMHLGSQIRNADPLRDALPRLLESIETARMAGHDLAYMDVGGGIAVPYEPHESAPDIDDYAELVTRAASEVSLLLLLEPGRFLVAESGVLLSRVRYRKHAAGKDFVIVDAAMNDLVRPSLYQAYHGIDAVGLPAGEITADVVGPVCESGDFLARSRHLPDLAAGDLVAVRTAGAYGYTMSSSYNSRGRPAEVLVDGTRFAIVTERESLADLSRLELSHPEWRSV